MKTKLFFIMINKGCKKEKDSRIVCDMYSWCYTLLGVYHPSILHYFSNGFLKRSYSWDIADSFELRSRLESLSQLASLIPKTKNKRMFCTRVDERKFLFYS